MKNYLGRELKTDEHVHHIDGNKENNDIANLKIVEGTKHLISHKTGISKGLDNAIIEYINNANDIVGTNELVEVFNVSRATIYLYTHLLVKYGKIKRYHGAQGAFVSVEKEVI